MSLQPEQQVRAVNTVNLPRERQTKAITKTEFWTDGVRIYFFCHRPWGTNDEQAMLKVPYAAIRTLPVLPQDHGHGEFRETWEESVYIWTAKLTIVFRFAKWQETDDCRMEGLVGGPYLAVAGGPSRVAAD